MSEIPFKKGDRVTDERGNIGTVLSVASIHNIEVEYDPKYIGENYKDRRDVGLYCIDKKCHMYEELMHAEDERK